MLSISRGPSIQTYFRRCILLFGNPAWAFSFSILFFFAMSFWNRPPWTLSNYPYFNYLADAFLHGQLHFRLLPEASIDLVQYQNQVYIYWPPFPALLLMPFVALFGIGFSDVFFTLVVGGLNVALVSALLGQARRTGLLGCNEFQVALLVVFFATGTVHLTLAPLGRVWYTGQVVGTLCVLAAYLAAISLSGWQAFLLTGLALAAALATRNPLLLTGIWPAWYLAWRARQRDGASWKHLAGSLLLAAAPILLTLALLGWYNTARFGDPFELGLKYMNQAPVFLHYYELYGAFNIRYVPTNLFYQYIAYPFLNRDEILMGGSLFLLSPIFFAAFWAIWHGRRNASTWTLLLTILAVDIPILLLLGTGFLQIGPRYTLDFVVPLLLLTAQGITRWRDNISVILALISLIHYFGGTIMLARVNNF